MKIGDFVKDGDAYVGELSGFAVNCFGLRFVPVTDKKGDSAPDFIVTGKEEATANEFEAGAAWRKTSKQGKPYLSVKLDGPALPQPIQCALIRTTAEGGYALVWSRDRKEGDAAAL